jgi:hypothetical protein
MAPVEIEKPSVSFTDEAQRALQNSLMRIERRIRAKAADHAIKVRGTPSEVTASDIEKAYRELVAFSNRYVVPSRIENGPKHWRKSNSLRLLATLYTWIGALTAVCGIVYPFVRTKLLDPSVRFSVLTGLAGVVLAALGLSLRQYLDFREAVRKEESLKRFDQYISVYRKPD